MKIWIKKLVNFRGRFLQRMNIKITKLRPRATVRYAREHFKGKEIVAIEIGVCRGGHAIQIMKNLNVKHIYLIDSWKEYKDYLKCEPNRTQKSLSEDFNICLKNLDKYKNKTYVIGFSEKVYGDVPKADYIYIDGNHDYKYVKEDIRIYFEKLNKGGILTGDDFPTPGVTKAVIEFCYERNLVPIIKNTEWIILK